MPRQPRRGRGRPPNTVPTVRLAISISAPVWERVKAEAKRRGKTERKLGAFVEEILIRALRAAPAKKEKRHV